jgi:hypothetical protein
MTCQEWERLVANEEAAAEIEEHLSLCPRCRALADEMAANAAALRSMRDEVLPAVTFRRPRPRRWIPAIAAAVVILALLGVRLRPLLGPVSPPPTVAVRVSAPSPVLIIPQRKPPATRRRPTQTLMVKMLTPDPDIVIYWLIEPNQGELE